MDPDLMDTIDADEFDRLGGPIDHRSQFVYDLATILTATQTARLFGVATTPQAQAELIAESLEIKYQINVKPDYEPDYA